MSDNEFFITPLSSPQSDTSLLQKKTARRIPQGTLYAEIPLEASKAYPTRLFNTINDVRIAYADLNTHQEQNYLGVKLLPNGGKTAPHPQIVLYVNGPYHVENLGYYNTNPMDWRTWMEIHLDAKNLYALVDALLKIGMELNR